MTRPWRACRGWRPVPPPNRRPGTEGEVNRNCALFQHDFCDGYIDVLGRARPCGCGCHKEDNPPDLQRAVDWAMEVTGARPGDAFMSGGWDPLGRRELAEIGVDEACGRPPGT